MKISYKPFFELIEKRNIKKYSLVKDAGVSNDVISHMCKDEPITMNALLKLCEALKCQSGDIFTFENNQVDFGLNYLEQSNQKN